MEDTAKPVERVPRGVLLVICTCFFLSGAAGLVYEVIWMRMLGLVFGHTVFAVTTVLAAFMTGLALGAFLFGRAIDRLGRPLRIYALLEGGIGIACLLVPFLLAQAQTLYLMLYRLVGFSFFALTCGQFVVVFLILLVPTTLMGASLPVVATFFVSRMEDLGRRVGDLYALNTFGAVAGAAAAGFFLVPTIGIRATTFLAASVNLAIAALTLMADRWPRRPHDVRTPPSTSTPASVRVQAQELPLHVTWLILAGIGLSGAASMVYEVAWTRALSLVVGSSTYAFSAMLTTFLVGLALGSFLFARIWGKRPPDAALFGWLELAVGLSALALVPTFERMPDLVLMIFKRLSPSPTGALLTQFGISFGLMIVPTMLIGATFPCAVQICARGLPRVGRDIGKVYSVNTVGTIVGTLLAGFLLVPWLGAQASMTAAAGINVAVGAAALAASTPTRRFGRLAAALPLVLLFIAGAVLVPRWNRQLMVGGVSIYVQRFTSEADPAARFRDDAASRQLLYYREGINSTVAVERSERTTSLKVGGKVDASNGADMTTQLMLGHLPILLHPRPERVLAIGLGSGVTVGALTRHPVVREIDVVELEPAVVEASDFFAEENRNALRDPRVRLVIGDARNFVLANTSQYDIVTSEPSNPWMAGVANLFSREFYQLVRRRLADDGIMVQWVHGYSLFPRELKMIVNTFRQVFPHSTLWRTMLGDYLLVGGATPLTVDYRLLEERIAAAPAIREDMALLRLDAAPDLLTFFLLDEGDLARFALGASENTDDKPLLEFAAPMALYADTTDANSQLLTQVRTSEFPPVSNLPRGLLEASRLHFARVYWARGETQAALEQLGKAPPPDPEDLGSRLDRAKLLFSLGQVAPATEELTRLAPLRPDDTLLGSYLKAGSILLELNAGEAVAQHGRTRLGDPNPSEAHNNLGVFYTRLGIKFGEPAFFDLAADSLEAALQIEPQAYAVLNNLGNAYFELGRLDDVIRVYQRAIELAPRLPASRFNLGLAYEKQGKLDLAAREFEIAAALEPAWELPRAHLRDLNHTVGSALGEGPPSP